MRRLVLFEVLSYGNDEKWELYSCETKKDSSREITEYFTFCDFSQWEKKAV
jgi:hypothetical protein